MSAKKEKLKRRVARRLREVRGSMSQAEFARRICVDQSYVSQWESGRSMPSAVYLFKIKEATGINILETKEEGHE